MHSQTHTQHTGREGARRALAPSYCRVTAVCRRSKQPLPVRTANLVLRAYVTEVDRKASVSTKPNGVSHELRDILKPTFNIVHNKRQNPIDKSGLSDIVHNLPSFKTKVKCTNATAAEASAELLSCLPSSPVTQALSEDVQSLMCQFLDVSDHVELRCLCTYFGEGTYYVPNAAVDRRKWMRALGIQDTNGFGVKSERFIQQASEWDVVILKGNAFPGNEGAGAVHKSPSASKDLPRLLLSLDKAKQHCCSDCP